MLRFFVIYLVLVNLILIEVDCRREERRKDVMVHRTRVKVRPVTAKPTSLVRDEANSVQFTNRHRRALDEETPSIEENNIIPKDTRPCILHSIRYGCMCRYGDVGCTKSLDDNFLFSSRSFDYII